MFRHLGSVIDEYGKNRFLSAPKLRLVVAWFGEMDPREVVEHEGAAWPAIFYGDAKTAALKVLGNQ